MPRIGVGQIGVGHPHAGGKIKTFRESPDFEVVGVAEPHAGLRELAAGDALYEGLEWMSVDELLQHPRVQAIAVETAVPDLLNVAEACIDAGKHIHLDKPAGISFPHFQRIVDKAISKHLVIQLGYMYRTHPGVELLDDLLAKGWLGEIYSVQAVIGKLMNASSRRGLLNQPGGMMFELGGHMLDILIHLLGAPQRAYGINRHSASIDDGYLDNMLAVLEYPRAHATLHCSCNDVDGFARRQLVVCGTEGTLEIRPMPNPVARLALTQDRGPYRKGWQELELPKYVRYAGDIAEFAELIRHERDPRYTFEHDLLVQKILLTVSDMPLD